MIRLQSPADVVGLVGTGTHVIVPLANGEPVALIDALDAHADQLDGVRVHQMHALHDHPYIHGAYGDRLRHVSYFLSSITRPAVAAGHCDLVPCHFSEVPAILAMGVRNLVVMAASSPPDRHGYFSLGTNADYVSGLIGKVPFILEANARMPRTFGRNSLHSSQVLAWYEVDRPLIEVASVPPTPVERRIAELVAERVPDGAVLQAGIGSIPNAVVSLLGDRRDLGVHTELLSDGVMALALRGVVTGVRKERRPTKMVGTFALGTEALYDFLHENASVELLPVEWVNDPRIIAQHSRFVSINASVEVDLLGQCASETIAGKFWSGSGGQADFARGAMYSRDGQGFVVLPSTARAGSITRIVSRLTGASVVTTLKNTVDKVVTEHGVAELRGRTVRQRALALIGIADPVHREQLIADARALNYI